MSAPSVPTTALGLAAQLAERFEGFRSAPYRDSTGVWTIGYGTTKDAHGLPVSASTPAVTRDQADSLMQRDLVSAQATVQRFVHVVLTSGQEAALIDFVYNLGAGAFEGSTLLKKLNAQDYVGAKGQFALWNHAGGKVLPGLTQRRMVEASYFG